MIKKILIALSILTFIFTTVCAVSPGEKKDQQETYTTEYRSEKFTVYCVNHSWSDVQLKADPIVFHNAKAFIPVNGDYLVLKGETIIYRKTDESLVAAKASLTQPDGTKRSTLGKITIPLDKPLEFKID